MLLTTTIITEGGGYMPTITDLFGADFVTSLENGVKTMFSGVSSVILAVIGVVLIITALTYVVRFIRSRLSR